MEKPRSSRFQITLLGPSVLLILMMVVVIDFDCVCAQQQLFDNLAEIKFTTNKTKIYLAAFVLNVEKDTYTSRAAMEVARSLINKDDRLLKDYEIVIHYHNSLGVSSINFYFQGPDIEEKQNILICYEALTFHQVD